MIAAEPFEDRLLRILQGDVAGVVSVGLHLGLQLFQAGIGRAPQALLLSIMRITGWSGRQLFAASMAVQAKAP